MLSLMVCTWNLQNCTYKSFTKSGGKKSGKQMELINVIAAHDLIALQEIRDTQCVEYVAAQTGYSYWISDPICSTESSAHQTGKRRERYAFLWNTKVKCIKSPVILNGNTAFVRPPAMGYFGVMRDGHVIFDFVLCNIHMVWGTKRDREIEINKTCELLELIYYELQCGECKEDNIIICGDFNNNMNETLQPGWFACINAATVVNSASHYDNFIISNKKNEYTTFSAPKNGVIRNTTISDHYPVYIELLCDFDRDDLVINDQLQNLKI